MRPSSTVVPGRAEQVGLVFGSQHIYATLQAEPQSPLLDVKAGGCLPEAGSRKPRASCL